MNADEQTSESTTLRYFLLGSSTEQQTELFEERCMLDDDFFERVEIAQDELLEEYSRNRLSKEDRALVERRVLTDSETKSRLRLIVETAAPLPHAFASFDGTTGNSSMEVLETESARRRIGLRDFSRLFWRKSCALEPERRSAHDYCSARSKTPGGCRIPAGFERTARHRFSCSTEFRNSISWHKISPSCHCPLNRPISDSNSPSQNLRRSQRTRYKFARQVARRSGTRVA